LKLVQLSTYVQLEKKELRGSNSIEENKNIEKDIPNSIEASEKKIKRYLTSKMLCITSQLRD